MKKWNLFALILGLNILNLQICFSQDSEKPIDYRFKGKEFELQSFLANNLRFPDKSIGAGNGGFSISGITITPKGTINNISIINSIDEYIDNEVVRVLYATRELWLECDSCNSNQTFYIQLGFNYGFRNNTDVRTDIDKNHNMFVGPVFATTTGNGMPFTIEKLIKESTKLISASKYFEALPFVNELIRRNPFSKELYQIRIMINSKIFRKDLVDEDLKKISNFIPGVSLDDLMKNQ